MVWHAGALLFLATIAGCGSGALHSAESPAAGTRADTDGSEPADDLEPTLRADPELATWLDDAARRRLQVLVAIPTAGANGRTTLRRLAFRAGADYFYPASAVKLCAAYAAVEKLEDLRDTYGGGVSMTSVLRFTEGEGQSRRVIATTLRREIELALVVSDNDAFNRLFDLVGRDELAERLAHAGLRRTRIVQYLGDGSRSAPPIIELVLPSGAAVLVGHRVGFPLPAPPATPLLLGRSHVDGQGRVVPGPMDFVDKNAAPLRELQDLLVTLARPELASARRELSLRGELLEILGTLPSELLTRSRSRAGQALDAFQKPLHVAISGALPRDPVKVYGKGGRAYGFSIENVYAVNESTGRSFFVAATIYTNDNETLNDDRYDYESVGTPFLTRLGTVLARELLAPGG